jgi:hypothetical protein
VELLELIFEDLPLCTLINLSRTCAKMHSLLSSNCNSEIQKLTAGRRRIVLRELAETLPDHYFCPSCNCLHRVEFRNVRSAHIPVAQNLCKPCVQKQDHELELGFFNHTAQDHIRLAIQYARVNDPRRIALMKSFTIRSGADRKGLAVSLTTTPFVVNGRFIVMTSRKFSRGSIPFTFSNFLDPSTTFFLCPHRYFHSETVVPSQVMSAIRTATKCYDKTTHFHSCDRCPTEYFFDLRNTCAFVYCWQEFGQETYWQSQVLAEMSMCRFRGFNKVKGRGGVWEYEHGSIRQMCKRQLRWKGMRLFGRLYGDCPSPF